MSQRVLATVEKQLVAATSADLVALVRGVVAQAVAAELELVLSRVAEALVSAEGQTR